MEPARSGINKKMSSVVKEGSAMVTMNMNGESFLKTILYRYKSVKQNASGLCFNLFLTIRVCI